LVEEVGTVKVNGQEGTQVRCFKGSYSMILRKCPA
jgi:hypothetical protein